MLLKSHQFQPTSNFLKHRLTPWVKLEVQITQRNTNKIRTYLLQSPALGGAHLSHEYPQLWALGGAPSLLSERLPVMPGFLLPSKKTQLLGSKHHVKSAEIHGRLNPVSRNIVASTGFKRGKES